MNDYYINVGFSAILVNITMLKYVLLSCLLAAAAAGPPLVKSRRQIENYRAALEASRADDGLTLQERMAKNPKSSAWVSSGKYQGDMILDEPIIEDMVNNYAAGRAAYIYPNTKWPEGIVIYEFGLGEFSLDQQRHILNVMQFMEENSCIRFRQRTIWDWDYVRLTGFPDGCYAHVGFWRGRGIHILNLARNTPGWGCLNSVIVAHEWLHGLGFFHMQSTYSRDNYVRIHWENIVDGMSHNFDRFDSATVSNLGLAYEYGSCMHYGTHDFSANGRPTISTTRPYNGVLGQTSQVTGLDFWRLRRHYNCPGAWNARALEEARRTIYVANEDGSFREEKVDIPFAEELELLEDNETA
ncbi:hypothetical protein ACJJTC_016758 [Scirpophaga incertulas]